MARTNHEAGWSNTGLARLYLDNLNDAVFVVDKQALVCEGNPAFFDLFGLRRPQTLRRKLRDCIGEQAGVGPLLASIERMAAGLAAGRELVAFADGSTPPRTMLLTSLAVPDDTGETMLAIRIEDLTKTIVAQARVEAESLQRLNEELEAFSYSVAHDLRAPLRFIDKFAYLLIVRHGDELSPEGLQFAEQIREGARQMSTLVEDLLQYSRATGQELRRERVDLDELAAGVVADVTRGLEGRAVDIRLGELGHCDADPILLRQVLMNLLWNAVKFTRPRESARIALERVERKQGCAYVVSDNGVGFDSRHADRLFTVFQRFHQPDEFEGSGVGLAIVKRIVERHGGKVWAEGEVGRGAKFFFTLGPPGPDVEDA